jgi:Probable metallopeptidase family (DUF6775)
LRISKIFLYDEPRVPEIKIVELAEFINKKTQIEVETRSNFLDHFNMKKDTSYQIASCKILNPYVPFEKHEPTVNEVTFEEQYSNGLTYDTITLYDGFELQNIFNSIIPESELDNKFHLAFTTRLTCTFDYDDSRYHGRAIICANPAIISTTGIIEAPAKPREYYLRIHEKISQGLNFDIIKDEFKGRFLEYHDKNLGLVVKGYALQAIFYYLTGQVFCQSKDCMLYNAHWQEDLIHSQIKIGTLCDHHQKILESFTS